MNEITVQVDDELELLDHAADVLDVDRDELVRQSLVGGLDRLREAFSPDGKLAKLERYKRGRS